MKALDKIQKLGQQGVIVSIGYGPCGIKNECCWTVMCLHGEERFDKPYAARSFRHAVEIAEYVTTRLGWVRDTGVETVPH